MVTPLRCSVVHPGQPEQVYQITDDTAGWDHRGMGTFTQIVLYSHTVTDSSPVSSGPATRQTLYSCLPFLGEVGIPFRLFSDQAI